MRALLPSTTVVAAALSLVACSPDVPEVDFGALADAFGVPNDIGINAPPDAGADTDPVTADAADADEADASAGDAATSDAAVDTTPEPATCSWQLVDTIPNPLEGTSYFGLAMTAADGDLVVSSAGVNASGRALVFEARDDGWALADTILPEPDVPQTLFGFSLAYANGTLAVGAPLGEAGAVHVYQRTTGTFTAAGRVSAPGADGLGSSVATDGDLILAGAPRASTDNGAFYLTNANADSDATLVFSGVGREAMGVAAVYVDETFVVASEERVAVLGDVDTTVVASNLPEDGGGSVGGLGAALAAWGGQLFVSAPGSQFAQGPGSVFVYARATGNYEVTQRIAAADGASLDQFGTDIAVDGAILAVGSSATYGTDGAQRGYVFERDDAGLWTEQAVFEAPISAERSGFSGAVAVIGDTVFFADALADASAGAVYAYRCVLDAT